MEFHDYIPFIITWYGLDGSNNSHFTSYFPAKVISAMFSYVIILVSWKVIVDFF